MSRWLEGRKGATGEAAAGKTNVFLSRHSLGPRVCRGCTLPTKTDKVWVGRAKRQKKPVATLHVPAPEAALCSYLGYIKNARRRNAVAAVRPIFCGRVWRAWALLCSPSQQPLSKGPAPAPRRLRRAFLADGRVGQQSVVDNTRNNRAVKLKSRHWNQRKTSSH